MRFTPMFAGLALIAAPALAQQSGMQGMDHSQMGGMSHGMSQADMQRMMAGNPYGQAEMDMHQKMMMAKRGDAAEMWTRKMIEHHRGAIAMSRVALREAKDPEVRREAQTTITKQEQDIAKLQAMLRKKGKSPE